MVNGTLLNFGKRYEDDLRVIFDQWQKLHLGLDELSNQKILKGIYYLLAIHSLRDDARSDNLSGRKTGMILRGHRELLDLSLLN